ATWLTRELEKRGVPIICIDARMAHKALSARLVEHYNHRRYHESLNNVTPADAYFDKADTIIKQRERIKRKTIQHRRLQHRKLAA
ncbi:hypothetical protein SAMN05421772_101686, partial [Paracoccus saliphilus]